MTQRPTYSDFDHDAYARSKDRQDFWGQIKRTVNGQSVSEDQIALIVAAISDGLDLARTDTVLDLACGNGALSARVFDACSKLHGVDLSEFLVSVAREHFERPPALKFSQGDLVAFLREASNPAQYSKVLCYGSFSYLAEEAAADALDLLYKRYPNVSRVFIGNLPDLDLRHRFFTRFAQPWEELKKHTTTIGIWRSESEFRTLANTAGWQAEFRRMGNDFYASRYRYDAVLIKGRP